MRTTDNNINSKLQIDDDKKREDLEKIANKNLLALAEEYPNLLIFPPKLGEHKDGIEKDTTLFHLKDNTLTTNNFMGFISSGETQLSITSRFYTEKDDYFLHYMLQKVFKINVLDFKIDTEKNNIWDIFLIYLFPFYLKKALNQGIYKE